MNLIAKVTNTLEYHFESHILVKYNENESQNQL
jgi:hypothetical protein